jgi:hypothetical protein
MDLHDELPRDDTRPIVRGLGRIRVLRRRLQPAARVLVERSLLRSAFIVRSRDMDCDHDLSCWYMGSDMRSLCRIHLLRRRHYSQWPD